MDCGGADNQLQRPHRWQCLSFEQGLAPSFHLSSPDAGAAIHAGFHLAETHISEP